MRQTLLLLPLLGCASPDPSDSLPTSGTLRVLTYNVAGLPSGLSSAEQPTPERMQAIAPFLDDYDLVGLQEDFTDEGHELLLAEASHPVQHWFDAVLASDRAYGSGLSLLSREGEPTDYAETHYSACHGILDGASDCLASKGFQRLRLELGGVPFDVYNTHHEAGGGSEDEAARTTQVDEVLAAIEGETGDGALLYMGDMNMTYSDPPDRVELERYEAAGLVSACDPVDCGEPDRIDRVMTRGSADLEITVTTWSVEAQFVDGDGVPLSDHEAVAVELDWQVR